MKDLSRELVWYRIALAYMLEHEECGNAVDYTKGVCEVLYECGINFYEYMEEGESEYNNKVLLSVLYSLKTRESSLYWFNNREERLIALRECISVIEGGVLPR